MATSWTRILYCVVCLRPFGVYEIRLPHGADATEQIHCPWCDAICGQGRTNGVFQGVELPPHVETRWVLERDRPA
jgi:hypothetical protein